MKKSREFRFPWRTRFQVAADVDAELAFHLAQVTEELVAGGLSPEEARREAARRFGDLEFTRQYCRDQDVRRERETRHMTVLHEIGQDLRYALRSLRSAKGFTLVALLTLALGIGANTAIFSVVRGVLLQPLPFPDADRVVRMWHVNREANIERSTVSEPDFLDWERATSGQFAAVAGYFYSPGGSGADLTGVGTPERIEGAFVTPRFFEVLRAQAVVGRVFRPEEATTLDHRFIVLSHGFWQRRFGGDPAVVGRPLTLSGKEFTVLGVMPAGFTYPADRLDYWIPLSTIPADDIGRVRAARFLDVIARLAPGVTLAQAEAEMRAVTKRVAEREADSRGYTDVVVLPIREAMLGEVRTPLVVLMGAVAFVLLITCVNLASLLLARASARQREFAVRAALGAGRGRIVRQLVTESLTLSLLGGALGVALAWVGVRALVQVGAAELPRAGDIRLDAPVLLFALAISLLSGLFFGILPAMRATARDLQGTLRAGARGTVGGTGQRLRSALVVTEVALAAVLVVGAGLAVKSLTRLLDVDPGFDARNALTVRLSLDADRMPEGAWPTRYRELLDRLRALPGVTAVGAAKALPLRGEGEGRSVVIPAGRTGQSSEHLLPMLHVSADYFRAMKIPLRAGRDFTIADDEQAPSAWIVNEAFARRFFPGESAVGKVVMMNGQFPFQIIGVVGDVRQVGLTEPAEPAMYGHYLQNRRSGLSIVIRTAGDPLRQANAVREAIWSLDRNQTITSIETLESVVGVTTARPRLLAGLLVLFGTMGLLLAALGIYGVLAFAVSQRRQEIGVRIALGATPRSVLRLVVGQGMALALVGVAVGIAGALAVTRVMSAVLYEVRATDPATFATVIGVLLAAALLASWLPARRAVKISPVGALRYD